MNWILMPAHNLKSMTIGAVESCFGQDIGDIGVWVINNASTDGLKEWLHSMDDVRATHHYPALASLSKAWNLGLSTLFAEGAEHVLVVNNDIRLLPQTYRLLVRDGGGFVTAVGKDYHSALTEDLPKSNSDASVLATPRRPHPDFSCFLIRREAWEKAGPFDERFKIAFCEDWDYHCRLHQAGVDAYCMDIPFLHYASATIKSLPKWRRQEVAQQADANREEFRKKWGFSGGSKEYYEFFKR